MLREKILRYARKAGERIVPVRQRLRLRYHLHRLSTTCEPELLCLGQLPFRREGVAIDVGANWGDYTFSMSELFEKVYAFEINECLISDLRAAARENIEIIPKGLSSSEGKATLYIPRYKGVLLNGWASLDPGASFPSGDVVEKPVRIATLDSMAVENVSLIKIDAEGHEREVLEGARETLRESRPLAIVEIGKENRETVRRFFADLGYETRTLEDLIGVPGSRFNRIFVPRES